MIGNLRDFPMYNKLTNSLKFHFSYLMEINVYCITEFNLTFQINMASTTGIERYNQTHILVYNDSELENNNEGHWEQFT